VYRGLRKHLIEYVDDGETKWIVHIRTEKEYSGRVFQHD